MQFRVSIRCQKKVVNVLSIKETVFDVTLVDLVIKDVQNFNCKTFEFLNFGYSLNSWD